MAYIPGWAVLSRYPLSPLSALCQPQNFRALRPGPGGPILASPGPTRPLTVQNPSALLLQQRSVMEDVKGRVWPGGPLGARAATHMDGAAGTSGGYPLWPEHNIGVQAPTLSTCPVCSGVSGLGRHMTCPKLSPGVGQGASVA